MINRTFITSEASSQDRILFFYCDAVRYLKSQHPPLALNTTVVGNYCGSFANKFTNEFLFHTQTRISDILDNYSDQYIKRKTIKERFFFKSVNKLMVGRSIAFTIKIIMIKK